jgi:hypothetical protein
VTEVIHPRDGAPVRLRPCPPWCTQTRHFTDDDVIYAEDGFHHYGPEITVPASFRMFSDSPGSVVKVSLKAWANCLNADPGPGFVELQLATTEYDTDAYVELTPGQARTVAAALLQLADTAAGPDGDEHESPGGR